VVHRAGVDSSACPSRWGGCDRSANGGRHSADATNDDGLRGCTTTAAAAATTTTATSLAGQTAATGYGPGRRAGSSS